MPYKNRKPSYGNYILLFVLLKVLFNLLCFSHYGFHRDELLHLALADHLSWGYKEVPPFIALLAFIVKHVLGGSMFATRLFPTIFSAALIWLVGKLVVEFGGRRFAIAVACLSIIFSPGFSGSGYLFQPVIFDQFWWVLSVWLLVKFINTKENKFIYLFGVAVGLGILTKYTMLFFIAALLIGLLSSKHRKLLISKPFLLSALIALLIFLPNIIWQSTHHLPVFTHMHKLQKYQLDGNDRTDFVKQTFLINGVALFVWLIGFVCFFASYKLRRYAFLAIAFVAVFTFLLAMHGKSYYLFPAFPMLFAAGGYMIERWVKTSWNILRVVIILLFTVPNMLLFPVALPFLPLKTTVAYIDKLKQRLPGFRFAVTWEDHKQHPLTQDYADMLGWDEMVNASVAAYNKLNPGEQAGTVFFADNYGESGAFMHLAPPELQPKFISMDSSFALWAPADLNAKNLIYISDDADVSDLIPFSESIVKVGEVTNPLAREYGTAVFLIKGIKPELRKIYQQHLQQKLLE
ncbi:ArnT family glycosyltransferase [Mucilaginibacter sp. KACC 22063]|uniref:ArnT family glycosyltransferase n=1 Tax=Mucilaginibacter sp. KACC 22063 TaxID=3025666 RepID=UPI002365B3DB|nr:glycosyltransferase family 39 protein [Mucilaginibacter sp. KACC 22063]WDF54057.1 glycosyltransferase family 39 protein [Mucilaginibacter sp. KACC 22063]